MKVYNNDPYQKGMRYLAWSFIVILIIEAAVILYLNM